MSGESFTWSEDGGLHTGTGSLPGTTWDWSGWTLTGADANGVRIDSTARIVDHSLDIQTALVSGSGTQSIGYPQELTEVTQQQFSSVWKKLTDVDPVNNPH